MRGLYNAILRGLFERGIQVIEFLEKNAIKGQEVLNEQPKSTQNELNNF